MPMVDPDIAGVAGDSEQFPWLDKNEVMNTPLAVVQAWGYQPADAKPESKFQVCLLVQFLTDKFDSEGVAFPEIGAISFDAESVDNPRRRWLAYFKDSAADPLGPLELQQVPAQNQQGWVWALRKCPLPVDCNTDNILRSLHRQAWRDNAALNYRKRQGAIEVARQAEEAARRAAQTSIAAAADLDELPF